MYTSSPGFTSGATPADLFKLKIPFLPVQLGLLVHCPLFWQVMFPSSLVTPVTRVCELGIGGVGPLGPGPRGVRYTTRITALYYK